jgi:hypothetical protein
MDVPEQLRRVLELALAEEATPENLEMFLPDVRSIIKNLLQGLRIKQHDYKVNGSRRSETPHSTHERSNSMAQSERSDRTSTMSRASTQQGSQKSNTFRPDPGMPMPTPPNSGGEQWVGGFAPPPPQGPGVQPQLTGDYQPSGPAQLPNRTSSRSSTASSSQQPYGRSPQAFVHQPVHEETDDDSSRKQAVLRKPSGHARSLSKASASSAGGPPNDAPRITSMAPQLPPLSADIKRYSLADNPILRNSPPPSSSSLPNLATEAGSQTPQHGRSPGGSTSTALPPPPPSVVIEPGTPVPPSEPAPPLAQPTINRPMSPSPPPDTPTSDGGQTELNDKALSALKSRDALSRRASKRFSTYTYNKMTSSPSATVTAASGTQLKNRRSMIAGNLLTTGDLNALSEVEDAPNPSKAQRSRTLDPGRRGGAGIGGGEVAPPVPPLPSTGSRFLPSTTEETTEEAEDEEQPMESAAEATPTPRASIQTAPPPPSIPPANRPFTVFLQLESQVRKAEFEPGMTIAALRILFVEKFAYNPGLDNFPDIYIRDPTSQVMYELEDISEVKEKSLLSLNIERESCYVPE